MNRGATAPPAPNHLPYCIIFKNKLEKNNTEGLWSMSASSPDHKSLIRQEFTQQAQTYAANPSIVDPARLNRLVQAVRPQSGARVLDVATGPGYVAMAFAEVGCAVVGLDLTEAPLKFAEQEFDIVVCRLALHHCEVPQRVLTEMTRVCRPQGMVVIEDLVTSEYPARAAYQNHFEQLRDPSHTRALPISEFLALVTAHNLEVGQLYTDYLVQSVEQWLANTCTPAEPAEQVRTLIAQDELHDLSGTRPFRRDGALYFHQRTAAFVCRKLAAAQGSSA